MATRMPAFPKNFVAALSSESEIKFRSCHLAAVILQLLMEMRKNKSKLRIRQPEELDQIFEAAVKRAIQTLNEVPDAIVVITIENGKEDILGLPYDTPLVYIRCTNNLEMESWGLPFPIPLGLWERVKRLNSEIGDQIPGGNHDPMGWFTNGLMDRSVICAWAVVMAFMPLIYSERFARPIAVRRSQSKIAQLKAANRFQLPDYIEGREDIAVGSENDIKLRGHWNVLTNPALQLPAINVVPFGVEPKNAVEPVGYGLIYAEALHRAMTAFAQYVAKYGEPPLYSLGPQTGAVIRRGKLYEIPCSVAIDRTGYTTTAWGMPIRLPDWMLQELEDGIPLRDGSAWEPGKRVGELDPGCLDNVLLYLSEGQILNDQGQPFDRVFLTEQVTTIALTQHIYRSRYQAFA